MKRHIITMTLLAAVFQATWAEGTEYDAMPSNASQVIGKAGAGDIVYLADGEYSNLWISASGSPNDFLTIKAAEGALPIVKGSSGSTCVDLSGNWVRIEGLAA